MKTELRWDWLVSTLTERCASWRKSHLLCGMLSAGGYGLPFSYTGHLLRRHNCDTSKVALKAIA